MAEPERVRTIADLARLAGVSQGTVSRALAGSPRISQATRARIKALAQAHNFRLNVMARNLRSGRAGAVGVLMPVSQGSRRQMSDPFFMSLIALLADALAARGYDLLLSRADGGDPDWLDALASSGRVDGVILIGQADQWQVIDRVAARYLPLVAWGAQLPGQAHCTVGTDNRRGGALAARHLFDRGARGFAFFGDPVNPEVAQRLEGVRDELAAGGLSTDIPVIRAGFSAQTAHEEISRWLDAGNPLPDAIVAASDVLALSAVRALAERGHRVPADVRVTGYDDLLFASQTMPPLTTVRQDLASGADHLVDLLLRRIGGEAAPSVVIEPTLVVRGSS